MAKVTFEFDYYEDRSEVSMIQNAGKMYCALFEIYNIIRTEFKHGDEEFSDYVDKLLERIQEEASMVHELDVQ